MFSRLQESKTNVDLMRRDFEIQQSTIDKMEVIVYKKKTDKPNIFDEIQNRIVDIVRKSKFHIFSHLKTECTSKKLRKGLICSGFELHTKMRKSRPLKGV